MVSTKKSIGNVTLAGIFAAATLAAAVPAFASTTTVTWDFNTPTSWANAKNKSGKGAIGTSATFTGVENPISSLQAPLSSDLDITAYGEKVVTTTTSSVSYHFSVKNWAWQQTGTRSTGPRYGTATATGLYAKNGGGTENGLGLNNFSDSEISDTPPEPHSRGIYSHNRSEYTVTTTTKYETGMVQLNISNLLTLLGYANNQDATLTIGSLQSPDTAIISASTALGDIGTQIGEVASASNRSDQSTTISLSELKNYTYLNITAAAAGQAGQWCQPGTPGQTVLLSTVSLNLPSNSGNPTPAAPAPVPASAGLTLVGALGMGMMLLARRRRSM